MKEEIIGFVVYLAVTVSLFIFFSLKKLKNWALLIFLVFEMCIGSFALAVTIENGR